MRIRLSHGEKVTRWIETVFFILLSFLFIYPFWYILVLSFNEGMDASKGGIYWWPREFTLGNYVVVLKDPAVYKAFTISVLRTVIGTAGSMVVTAMVAYGLSRKELPGRKALVTIFFIPMLFGGGLIPYYLQLINLKLINSFWVYIIPSLFNVWNMIVMKTSFKSNISESIIESARIDGAGFSRIFFAIVLPLSVPLMASLSLFTAVGHWNDWFTGAFYVNNPDLQPLQTYLQKIMSDINAINMINSTQMETKNILGLYNLNAITTRSVKMATIMVSTLPILFIYPFVQRFFVKGVMIGSIKE
ncbi:carbohydrate ABC transporter permease [Paenibacillus lautus]|uniref:carbohydrate ABC transporter permease n=1 Tax=Paenibacillus lautus TaxID=1401 RepID=UPI001C10DB0C|nr:carbohydrate ABC transporter permease [Paenibacillus lautus]MBU5346314.1 carbohydrate ABC transporter permease [Paenibacillus lautus]